MKYIIVKFKELNTEMLGKSRYIYRVHGNDEFSESFRWIRSIQEYKRLDRPILHMLNVFGRIVHESNNHDDIIAMDGIMKKMESL